MAAVRRAPRDAGLNIPNMAKKIWKWKTKYEAKIKKRVFFLWRKQPYRNSKHAKDLNTWPDDWSKEAAEIGETRKNAYLNHKSSFTHTLWRGA